MKEFLDKVLLTLLATVLSSYILYSYNLYTKAFDSAQVQARPYSRLAEGLYTLIQDKVSEATSEVKLQQLSGDSVLSEKVGAELFRLSKKIRIDAGVLKPAMESSFEETADIAIEIANRIDTAVGSDFATPNSLTQKNVSNFTDSIVSLQTKFTNSYLQKIGVLVSAELGVFQQSFNEHIPFYARPEVLLVIGLTLLALYFVGVRFSAQ